MLPARRTAETAVDSGICHPSAAADPPVDAAREGRDRVGLVQALVAPLLGPEHEDARERRDRRGGDVALLRTPLLVGEREVGAAQVVEGALDGVAGVLELGHLALGDLLAPGA